MHLDPKKSIYTHFKPERASETQVRNALGFIIRNISDHLGASIGVRSSIATGKSKVLP